MFIISEPKLLKEIKYDPTLAVDNSQLTHTKGSSVKRSLIFMQEMLQNPLLSVEEAFSPNCVQLLNLVNILCPTRMNKVKKISSKKKQREGNLLEFLRAAKRSQYVLRDFPANEYLKKDSNSQKQMALILLHFKSEYEKNGQQPCEENEIRTFLIYEDLDSKKKSQNSRRVNGVNPFLVQKKSFDLFQKRESCLMKNIFSYPKTSRNKFLKFRSVELGHSLIEEPTKFKKKKNTQFDEEWDEVDLEHAIDTFEETPKKKIENKKNKNNRKKRNKNKNQNFESNSSFEKDSFGTSSDDKSSQDFEDQYNKYGFNFTSSSSVENPNSNSDQDSSAFSYSDHKKNTPIKNKRKSSKFHSTNSSSFNHNSPQSSNDSSNSNNFDNYDNSYNSDNSNNSYNSYNSYNSKNSYNSNNSHNSYNSYNSYNSDNSKNSYNSDNSDNSPNSNNSYNSDNSFSSYNSEGMGDSEDSENITKHSNRNYKKNSSRSKQNNRNFNRNKNENHKMKTNSKTKKQIHKKQNDNPKGNLKKSKSKSKSTPNTKRTSKKTTNRKQKQKERQDEDQKQIQDEHQLNIISVPLKLNPDEGSHAIIPLLINKKNMYLINNISQIFKRSPKNNHKKQITKSPKTRAYLYLIFYIINTLDKWKQNSKMASVKFSKKYGFESYQPICSQAYKEAVKLGQNGHSTFKVKISKGNHQTPKNGLIELNKSELILKSNKNNERPILKHSSFQDSFQIAIKKTDPSEISIIKKSTKKQRNKQKNEQFQIKFDDEIKAISGITAITYFLNKFWKNKSNKSGNSKKVTAVDNNPFQKSGESINDLVDHTIPPLVTPNKSFHKLLSGVSYINSKDKPKTILLQYMANDGVNFLVAVIKQKKLTLLPGFLKIRKNKMKVGIEKSVAYTIPWKSRPELKNDKENSTHFVIEWTRSSTCSTTSIPSITIACTRPSERSLITRTIIYFASEWRKNNVKK
ncbi:hypothetical protein M0812_12818 [Anaeramoeba flamelloides]|uniref:Uncharacterized protein n=1 Tax=Anaeramoeba flamelloides TaxID=1746091 RepID=A0AAV7ZPK0_9EUKA|nr:hypothetical protein M0812_12818 [Anaeramoeba flamelloides]